MKQQIKKFIPLLTVFFFFGCTGYHLGGSKPEGIKTVYLEPIINKTSESAIEIQATEALRQRIQFDGRTTLVNRKELADGVITVTLSKFTISAISFRKDLKTTPKQYRMRITATTTLTDQHTGKILSKSETYGETVFSYNFDLTTSKRDALPAALQELNKFILDDLIERW